MLVADPTMGQTFFNHFRCRTLSEELWVLDSDYSIECSPEDKTSQWWLLAALSSVGLAFVIGFPVGASSSNCTDAAFVTPAASRTGMWVWMRREMKKERAMVRRNEKSLVVAQRDFGVRFNYIAGEFKPEAYYAEPVDLLRKLMLTGFLGIIPAGTVLQSFCCVGISLFFLAMHVWMW